jgi:hypothetical protein
MGIVVNVCNTCIQEVRHKDGEFEASLGHVGKPYLKNRKEKN